jgi:hypothetical protein
VPCHFSTGCRSYGEGDVTGLELSDGEIRPVRQLNDEYQPKKKPLSAPPCKLRDVFAPVAAAQP